MSVTAGIRGVGVGRMAGEPAEARPQREVHRGDPLANPRPHCRAWAVAARRRRGETLRAIAHVYGVSHEAVRLWERVAPGSYAEAQALDGNACFEALTATLTQVDN